MAAPVISTHTPQLYNRDGFDDPAPKSNMPEGVPRMSGGSKESLSQPPQQAAVEKSHWFDPLLKNLQPVVDFLEARVQSQEAKDAQPAWMSLFEDGSFVSAWPKVSAYMESRKDGSPHGDYPPIGIDILMRLGLGFDAAALLSGVTQQPGEEGQRFQRTLYDGINKVFAKEVGEGKTNRDVWKAEINKASDQKAKKAIAKEIVRNEMIPVLQEGVLNGPELKKLQNIYESAEHHQVKRQFMLKKRTHAELNIKEAQKTLKATFDPAIKEQCLKKIEKNQQIIKDCNTTLRDLSIRRFWKKYCPSEGMQKNLFAHAMVLLIVAPGAGPGVILISNEIDRLPSKPAGRGDASYKEKELKADIDKLAKQHLNEDQHTEYREACDRADDLLASGDDVGVASELAKLAQKNEDKKIEQKQADMRLHEKKQLKKLPSIVTSE